MESRNKEIEDITHILSQTYNISVDEASEKARNALGGVLVAFENFNKSIKLLVNAFNKSKFKTSLLNAYEHDRRKNKYLKRVRNRQRLHDKRKH